MKRLVCLMLSTGMLTLGLALVPAMAEWPEKGSPTDVIQGVVRNEHPAFVVRVDVDHPDRTYQDGEQMQVTVMSEKEGYLYLLHQSAEGKLGCLFPNRVQRDNLIADHKEITVPASDALFRLRMGPPYGTETLMAVVTHQQVPVSQFGVKSLIEADVTPLNPDDLEAVVRELQNEPAGWAEHHVSVTTTPRRQTPPSQELRRVALLIGISEYQDDEIRNLTVSHRDAQVLAAVLSEKCQFDDVILLVNQQATLANIREAICTTLVQNTRPGDEVFIFWSGHGGRCADDNGDEPDGYDEYMVPYDARVGSLNTLRRTMLIDDTFGRWVQDLDGRKVVMILDTCYSGGQATQEKGLGLPDPAPAGVFDFFDGELARTKDVGQKEAALMCSAKASQIAFERREEDLSVMSYFLIESLLDDASRPITLTAAFDYVKVQVPAYVRRSFPGTTQTPVLINDLSGEFHLRP